MFYSHGLTGRIPTVTSLYEFARHAGGGLLNLFAFFGLTVKQCPGLENTYTSGCDNLWLEQPFQGSRDQNRSTLTTILAQAELAVANYVGYWPGPKYIRNERHFMKNWNSVITTNYMRVPVTGQRKRTLVFTGHTDGSGTVPMTRVFMEQFHTQVNNIIRYTFGEIGTPLNLPDDCDFLFYPQLTDTEVFGSGDEDEEKTLNEAYNLRPYVIVSRSDEQLVIDVPLVTAVKPSLYFRFPDIKGNVRFLDACNEDNFVDKIAVYAETFEKPDGYVKIAKDHCRICGGGGCDACDLPELPVCLVPVSSEHGVFQVRPIRNTGTDEAPCWEISDMESCCEGLGQNLKSGRTFETRWACDNFCTQPLELCIDYVSSCNNCYGDGCLEKMICPELLDPITKIALANLPVLCDCECLQAIVARLQDDHNLSGKGFTRRFVDDNQYTFGMKVGQVDAFLALQHVQGKHKMSHIGMVG